MDVEKTSGWRATAAVFLGSVCALWVLCANRLVLINDEGGFLDVALKILRGQVPYRDFFILTGPLTYWLNAIEMRIFGISLVSVHLLLILDIAVFTACTYWLTARLAGTRLGLLTGILFFIYTTADGNALTVNHRWDAGALAYIAIVLVFSLLDRPSAAKAAGAGLCAAASAWVLPLMALPGIALAGWLAFHRDQRRHIAPFFAGGALATVAAGGWLAAQGALVPMLQHFLWTGANYSRANAMPYGSVIGGYGALFAGSSGAAETAIRALLVFYLALPAVLPIAAIGGWAVLWIRRDENALRLRRPVSLLLATGAGWLASATPRYDINHLWFVGPLFFVLSAPLLARAPGKLRPGVFLLFSFLAAMLLWNDGLRLSKDVTLETPVGKIRGEKQDMALVADLAGKIHPGDTVFAFPYLPIVYFVTRAENVTRYSFLQPGMMVESDELAALEDLRAHPPRWVVYNDVPPEAYLRIWPSSNPQELRMAKIEGYIRANYRLNVRHQHPNLDFEIMERDSPPLAAGDSR